MLPLPCPGSLSHIKPAASPRKYRFLRASSSHRRSPPGDVVILDNLPANKSEKAKATLKERGAWFLFLPPYSPALNPIEMAFSKLKAQLRRIGARTIDDLWKAVGSIRDLYAPDERCNYFAAAGYAFD